MSKPTLIYVYDPLCSWCYGFHPVVQKLAVRFKNDLHIRIIPGGLAVGENAQTIQEGYRFIKKAHHKIEKTTGVTFGDNFKLLADEGSYLMDSEPACIAQTVINTIAPNIALKFAGSMQHALYVHGKSLNHLETFVDILKDFDVDLDIFNDRYNNLATKKETHQQFEWCKKNGASVFPTLLLKIGDEFGVMAQGYRPFDTIESHLHHLLNNYKKLST